MFGDYAIAACDCVPDDTRREAAAAVGQRSHGRIVIPEVGVTGEHMVPGGEITVDTSVELILVVGFHCCAHVVIGRAGQVWQRIMLEDFGGDRIETRRGNCVIGKSLAGRSNRIVDG